MASSSQYSGLFKRGQLSQSTASLCALKDAIHHRPLEMWELSKHRNQIVKFRLCYCFIPTL